MSESENPRSLILASTSRYRAAALRTLNLKFISIDPRTNEQPLAQEDPHALSLRLAHSKAAAVARNHPDCIVIGSDQVGYCNGQQLQKPHSMANAVAQLKRCSGELATFFTAVAVHDGAQRLAAVTTTELQFRDLSDQEIEAYVAAEPALDCAGGFKVEGLGISLFDRVDSVDPSALVGLPLITTVKFLRLLGCDVLHKP